MILNDGELQINEKERKDETEKLYKDVATIIVEKFEGVALRLLIFVDDNLARCIHADTKQALTIGVVEKAMKVLSSSIAMPSQY